MLNTLKNIWGYENLRPGQTNIVETLLSGKNVIGIMPTGEGKSICFQLPAMYKNWRVLVFSPLLSLQADQVQRLNSLKINCGMVNSLQNDKLNDAVIEKWINGEINFLYCAPEKLYNEEFKRVMNNYKPDLIVIDEAHCISRWGKDFRTAYMRLGAFIKKQKMLCIALTATATADVIADIGKCLSDNNHQTEKILYYPQRKNLHFKTIKSGNSYKDLVDMLKNYNEPTIIYTATTTNVEKVAIYLQNKLKRNISIYHGQLGSKVKTENQDAFMSGKNNICVATNAFGMGVDKANIRLIIHIDCPLTVEDYVQETGRAGRDGLDSDCIIFDNDGVFKIQMYFLENKNPEKNVFEYLINFIKINMDDKCQLRKTVKQIANYGMGFTEEKVNTALKIMTGYGMIKKFEETDKTYKVKIYENNNDKYLNLIQQYVYENGWYLVNILQLADDLKLKQETVSAYLNKLNIQKKIDMQRPYRGNIINLVNPNIEIIDFEYLEKKKQIEIAEFKKMIDYIKLPDSEKSDYLYNYFSIDNQTAVLNTRSEIGDRLKQLDFYFKNVCF